MSNEKSPRVALVHDWLTNVGGAEKVLLAIHQIYPEAPVYTSVYNAAKMPAEFKAMDVRTSWLQRIPLAKSRHQLFPVLRAKAFESFNFDSYDIVISDSSSDAKGIKVDPAKTLHICYCHTPTRYYWSHYDEYKKSPGFGKLNWLIRPFIPLLVRPMRRWDFKAAQRVDKFIANSSAVAGRIKKYYGRDSAVLFPPVDAGRFSAGGQNRHGLVAAGRQVAYKRFDLAVMAANQLAWPLTVIGDGPEHESLVKLAGPTVKFVTANDSQLADYYSSAELLLFPGEEDAGIVPLEAMASGTPVVAYGRGGVLDSIIDGKTGVLFKDQTVTSLIEAITEAQKTDWDHGAIRSHAEKFSVQNFQKKLNVIVKNEYAKFKN